MDTTLIAHLAFGAAALLTLIGMLLKDTALLQLNHFSNSSFSSHLQEKGELYTVPRLAAIAVLAGSITTMAKESWMVVIILAVVLAILGPHISTDAPQEFTASRSFYRPLQHPPPALA